MASSPLPPGHWCGVHNGDSHHTFWLLHVPRNRDNTKRLYMSDMERIAVRISAQRKVRFVHYHYHCASNNNTESHYSLSLDVYMRVLRGVAFVVVSSFLHFLPLTGIGRSPCTAAFRFGWCWRRRVAFGIGGHFHSRCGCFCADGSIVRLIQLPSPRRCL